MSMTNSDARKRKEGSVRYRKKPVEVMAWDIETLLIAYQSSGIDIFPDVIRNAYAEGVIDFDHDRIDIVSLEGLVVGRGGDMLICGVQGEFYPCKTEIFHQTYEQA